MIEKQSQGILVLIAIFIPPLAVFMERGCGCQVIINIILCILGYIPAIIHAIIIILIRKPEQNRDIESGGQQRSANEPKPPTQQETEKQQPPLQQQQNQLQQQNEPQETPKFPEPPKFPEDQSHNSALNPDQPLQFPTSSSSAPNKEKM